MRTTHCFLSAVLLAFACFNLVAPASAGSTDQALDIYWIDTEGGAATLIVTPRGESILVDAGNAGDRDPQRIVAVVRDVARLGRIDHHIITHWHSDHFGGTAAVARDIPIGRFYDHGPSVETPDFDQAFAWYIDLSRGKRTILQPGSEIHLAADPDAPPLRLVCVAAAGKVIGAAPAGRSAACSKHEPQPEDKTDNAQSVGFKLSFGSFDFLDLGDLTWNVEHDLVCPANAVGQIDVFQTSHHGLAVSNNPALVHAIRPQVAVMNNGARKGGELPVMATLRGSPGIAAIFQVHRNVRTTPEDNAPAGFIANHDEMCTGEYVWLKTDASGKRYSIAAGRNGKPQSYESR